MSMERSTINLLKKLRGELRHGDNSIIAERTGFTPTYVGMCLNPNTHFYNDAIVNEAIKLVEENAAETQKTEADRIAKMQKLESL